MILTISVVSLSAFAVDNYDAAAFARICYQYRVGAPNPPSSSDILNLDNWAVTTTIAVGNNGEVPCPSSDKLCVVCFDDTQFTGTADQKLTQALNVLTGFGYTNLTSDPEIITFGGKTVTVYQKN